MYWRELEQILKILKLDIETAPAVAYVWNLFQRGALSIDKVISAGYTLCWAAQWHGEKEVKFSSVWNHDIVYMLLKIHKLLDEADAVVHYYGRKFDIPTLNREFVKYNIDPPSPYHQIDLIETVRKRFKFDSNKLDFVCRELGLGAKVQHKGMALWIGCMDGDPKAQRKMEVYNKQDVRLLGKLYKHILPWIQDHPNHSLYLDDDSNPIVCTNCGSKSIKMNGMEHLKTQSYQRYKCKVCGTPIRGRSTILSADKRKTILTQSKL